MTRKSGRHHGIQVRKVTGDGGGMSFQLPPGWDDGSGKIRHVTDGPHKGRVFFTSRHEAKEIAKRMQDKEERFIRYDS